MQLGGTRAADAEQVAPTHSALLILGDNGHPAG
jgi:hypothetical protein